MMTNAYFHPIRGQVTHALFQCLDEADSEFLEKRENDLHHIAKSELSGWHKRLEQIDQQLAQNVLKEKVLVDSMTMNQYGHYCWLLQEGKITLRALEVWLAFTFKSILEKINEYKTLSRQQFVETYHRDLEKAAQKHFEENPQDQMNLACQSGCGRCCHQYIPATWPEFEMIAEKYPSQIARIEQKTLIAQSYYPLHSHNKKSNYPEQRCSFLDDNQNCTIYQYRPGMCRSYFALHSNQYCSFFDPESEKSQTLVPALSSVCLSAALTLFGETSLAELALLHLQQERSSQ